MTTPRGTYGGGYYASSSFADTPIYDSLVAERGTPQIAPIRVSLPSYESGSNLPALPARPALPSGPSSHPMPVQAGYPGQMPPMHPVGGYPQQMPAPFIPQQMPAQRGYPQQMPPQAPGPYPNQGATGYDAVRPVPPRPVPPRPMPPRQPAPGSYPEDPYRRPYNGYSGYNGQGY